VLGEAKKKQVMKSTQRVTNAIYLFTDSDEMDRVAVAVVVGGEEISAGR
jgi:Holliday junction resolvasome RuvABC endonuclease subunit